MTEIVGILLAAGSGQRFGAHKLLHPLDDGTPVGIAAARALIDVLPHTIAVVRCGDHALREAFVDLGLSVIDNPMADSGMGSSLATGVQATSGAEGWMIALADMPWTRPATIRRLVDRLREGAAIVAPVHAGRRGHPVGFARHWGERLAALGGEQGARDLIAAHRNAVHLYATEDAGVLHDIDRPSDLRQCVDVLVGKGKQAKIDR